MDVAQARQAARRVAVPIASGELDPYDGALAIWKDVLEVMQARIPDDLWAFKSNASAIEDCLWNAAESGADHTEVIARCREEIVLAAQALAATSEPRGA